MKPISILISDPIDIHHDIFEMIIDGVMNAKIEHVNDSYSALEMIKAQHFDLIISSYVLPPSGVKEIVNALEQKTSLYIFAKGEKDDYFDLKNLSSNSKIKFFSLPINEKELGSALALLQDNVVDLKNDLKGPDDLIKIKLKHFIQYSNESSEVYIQIHEGKFTKIIDESSNQLHDKDLLSHYMQKKLEYIYISKRFYKKVIDECLINIKKEIHKSKEPLDIINIAKIQFHISLSGLQSIGISDFQIEQVSEVIEETINDIVGNPECKLDLKTLCKDESFLIGHSIITMIIAGAICKETGLNFHPTMKRICMAAFFHDFSLIEHELEEKEAKIYEIEDEKLFQVMINHPINSAKMLPSFNEIVNDTKRIILEHHEMPNGDGYPKKLTANQIAPLSALFVLSHQITLCLFRNDFDKTRLKDFITNNEIVFKQGNFSKFYQIAAKKFS